MHTALLQEVDFQTPDAKHNGRKGSTGLVDIHKDLPKAVAGIFHGSAAQRKAVIQDLYAEVRMSALLNIKALLREGAERARPCRALRLSIHLERQSQHRGALAASHSKVQQFISVSAGGGYLHVPGVELTLTLRTCLGCRMQLCGTLHTQ